MYMHSFQLHTLVLHSLTFYAPVAYAVMALGAAIEGDAFIFASSFLAHQGIFNPVVTFIVLYTSVIVGDVLWYKLGAATANSSWRIFRLFHRFAPYIDRHLQKRLGKALFFTKFMYGIHHVALLRAGALHVDLKRFVRVDLAASLLWIAVIGGLAFLTGEWLPFLRHSLRFTEIALMVGLVIFFGFEYALRRLANLVLPVVIKKDPASGTDPEQK